MGSRVQRLLATRVPKLALTDCKAVRRALPIRWHRRRPALSSQIFCSTK